MSNDRPPVDVDRLRAGERLSRERVVQAAVAVTRRDGFDGLSMRRLAAELGVSTMAAYRHIPGKDGLDDEVVDAVISTIPLDDLPERWDDRLVELLLRTADVFAEFPGLGDRLVARTVSRPGVVRWLQAIGEPLESAGVPAEDRRATVAALLWMLRGASRARLQWDDAINALEEVRRAEEEDLLDAPLVAASAEPLSESDSHELLERSARLLLEGVVAATSASRA